MHKNLILGLLLLSFVLLTACTNTGNATPAISPAATGPSTGSMSPSATSQGADAGQSPRSSSRTLPVGAVKTHNAGNVSINIRLQEVKDDSILFKVVMDTHSVDLDPYDLSSSSYLMDDKGNKHAPLIWQSPPGGHHRTGDLVFPLPPSVSAGEAAYIELVIENVAIPRRVLTWELKKE